MACRWALAGEASHLQLSSVQYPLLFLRSTQQESAAAQIEAYIGLPEGMITLWLQSRNAYLHGSANIPTMVWECWFLV